MRQKDIVDEIRKLCGHAELLPAMGWHFMYNRQHYFYLKRRNEEMMRFCMPHLVKADDYDKELLAEAINDTNRNNRLGMIDKRGKWVLEPVYTAIEPVDSFWIVEDGQKKCVMGGGLMTAEGQVVIPPSYCSIKAIGYDLYLCKDNYEDGIILNGKGERIR